MPHAPASRSLLTRSVLALALGAALAGCGPSGNDNRGVETAAVGAAQAEARAAQLEQLYAEYWEERLQRNPVQATFIGDHRYNDRLPNFLAPDYIEENRALAQRWLERARAIGGDGLDGQARLSYEIFVHNLEGELAGYRFPQHLAPLNQFYNLAGQYAMLGSGSSAQPFVTVQDYDHWLARAGNIPALFDQMIANLREGVHRGIVQPRVLIEKVIPQLDALIHDDPTQTLFWQPIAKLPADFSAADRARLTEAYRTLIADTLMPAYRRLRDYVANEYLPACRDSVGLSALPDGEAWYAWRVAQSTTTTLTPEQIHQIGLDEVARIHTEMLDVAGQLGVERDLAALFAHVQSLPESRFADEDDLLNQYRAFRATVDPLLPALFDLMPRADFEIRPVEAFRAPSASAASYQAPSQDGRRPGIFYVNTYDIPARPRYSLEALYLHEATPGHHFQIALQRELTDLPAFRRFGGETAFSEGWGLYAESLGKELGVYRDPLMYFGALEYELWRSIRLVVDTGLHAKGWSRQDVLDYMYANSPVQPTRAVSEAERFMAIPGQALAYKIGQLKIRELRDRAEAALGERFDVRAFHREVLKDGSVPLNVLEAKIERWIETQRG
ncbi:DUF885 domain-containing protein [Rehaibacterium terrae]|uniref:Uncharacterized protein (DUF885 family) n=1 Tax=Rehaibacterium terrae TaxID=1341696 RepID=A0A7W8DEI5_9GAMM|nr:DUF885 family protein [Rehaibacterium terrae]MBB5015735.1 uncharacterized protein (DUF885 family) [Rehaibacterium terrae]